MSLKYNFIVVEGFDGSGKSTITKWMCEQFGYEYHKTPMGLFASIRNHFDMQEVNLVERFCFYAADCMRASIYIQKKLKEGQPIILDRYYYSTISYHESKYPGISKLLPNLFAPLLKPDLILYVKTNFSLTKERMLGRVNSPDDVLFLTEEYYSRIENSFISTFDSPYKIIDNSGKLEDTQSLIRTIIQ